MMQLTGFVLVLEPDGEREREREPLLERLRLRTSLEIRLERLDLASSGPRRNCAEQREKGDSKKQQ
jgi:hypothetical protein